MPDGIVQGGRNYLVRMLELGVRPDVAAERTLNWMVAECRNEVTRSVNSRQPRKRGRSRSAG